MPALLAGCIACTTARADDDGLAALERGDCAAAGAAINDGIGRADAQSYYLAGYLYAWTGCVTEDVPRALRFWQRAAELGSIDARNALGMMHGMGYGVPQDYRAAYRWFTYGKPHAESAAPDAAAEMAYGYVNTVTQVAARRVVYPRSFDGRQEGTIFVTVHSATRKLDYATTGSRGDSNPERLARSGPFRSAIDRAFAEAFELVPSPAGLTAQHYAFETPWRFVMR